MHQRHRQTDRQTDNRQTTDRQTTDGRLIAYSERNVVRSLKTAGQIEMPFGTETRRDTRNILLDRGTLQSLFPNITGGIDHIQEMTEPNCTKFTTSLRRPKRSSRTEPRPLRMTSRRPIAFPNIVGPQATSGEYDGTELRY